MNGKSSFYYLAGNEIGLRQINPAHILATAIYTLKKLLFNEQ